MDARTDAHSDARPTTPTRGGPDPAPEVTDPGDGAGPSPAQLSRTQQQIRAGKLAALRAGGTTLPYRYPVDHALADIRAAHAELEPDHVTSERVQVAGRLVGLRRQGGL